MSWKAKYQLEPGQTEGELKPVSSVYLRQFRYGLKFIWISFLFDNEPCSVSPRAQGFHSASYK